MHRASLLLGLILSLASLDAHEGHSHEEGVGAIVTSAMVTGSEGFEFVTAPGWGVPANGQNIGNLHGDVTLDKAGHVYASTNSIPAHELHDSAFSAPHGIKWGSQGQNIVTEYSKVGRLIALFPKK